MAASPFTVRILPDDRVYAARGPVELYLASAATGILLEQPCGSQGTCGRCRVRVVAGAPPPGNADRQHLSSAEIENGWRLGCQLVLADAAVVEVPVVARSPAGKSFGADLPADALSRPVVEVVSAVLPVAGTSRNESALDTLALALGRPSRSMRASALALGELARARRAAAPMCAVIHGDDLVSVRSYPTRPCVGLAVDIGTTSLAAALVRLSDGSVQASASCLNPQVAFGADVIARIKHATDEADGLLHLSRAVRDGLAGLVSQLTTAAGCEPGDVVIVAVAGNPTMMHGWAGVSPEGLGRAPYAGVWSDRLTLTAGAVQLPVHPDAPVLAFPLVRSHVGGDAIAAAIACDLDRPGGRRLLVDLGTNTEIMVACGARVVVTSAAAGPAFEGVSIRHGTRGAPGAIDVVSMTADGRVLANTIGGLPANGICGSGLIDVVAELLQSGIVAPSGCFRKAEDIPSPSGRALAGRLTQIDRQQAFVVVPAGEAAGSEAVVLTARDVREVQLAKGSILAAATLACRHTGIDLSDLDEVLVAGAFGNCIRKASAVRIGLVPPIDPERIRFVGNAAGVGARLAVVDRDVLVRARSLADRAEYLDLAGRASYEQTFMAALGFPG